jgi:hypothetical protein
MKRLAFTDLALVINVLRGLNSDYSSAITYLSGKDLTPSFIYTRSHLLPEESRKSHTHKMEAATALLATGSTGSKSGASSKPDPPAAPGGGERRKKWKPRDGRGRSDAPDAPRQPGAPQPPTGAPQQWGSLTTPGRGSFRLGRSSSGALRRPAF